MFEFSDEKEQNLKNFASVNWFFQERDNHIDESIFNQLHSFSFAVVELEDFQDGVEIMIYVLFLKQLLDQMLLQVGSVRILTKMFYFCIWANIHFFLI